MQPAGGGRSGSDVLTLGGLALVTARAVRRTASSETAARVLHVAATERVSLLLVTQSSSSNAVCVVTPSADAARLQAALLQRAADGHSLATPAHVSVDAPVALVSVVDDELVERGGVVVCLSALGNAGINIIAIALNARERRITCCVREADREAADRAIRAALAHHTAAAAVEAVRTR